MISALFSLQAFSSYSHLLQYSSTIIIYPYFIHSYSIPLHHSQLVNGLQYPVPPFSHLTFSSLLFPLIIALCHSSSPLITSHCSVDNPFSSSVSFSHPSPTPSPCLCTGLDLHLKITQTEDIIPCQIYTSSSRILPPWKISSIAFLFTK
jgi:hypothetical protein